MYDVCLGLTDFFVLPGSGRRFVRPCASFDAHLIPPEVREETPGAELKNSELAKLGIRSDLRLVALWQS